MPSSDYSAVSPKNGDRVGEYATEGGVECLSIARCTSADCTYLYLDTYRTLLASPIPLTISTWVKPPDSDDGDVFVDSVLACET